MTIDIDFPIEFLVPGRPVSAQAKRPESRSAWKARVKEASAPALPDQHFSHGGPIAITLFYFPDAEMQGDIDNIVKPVLDALCQHIYQDDKQVERVLVQKFEPGNVFGFNAPTAMLQEHGRAAALYQSHRRSNRGPQMTSSSDSQIEAAVFQAILPRLEAEGFEVFLHPAKMLLPPFLGSYRPGAIALKGDRKVAIQLARAGGRTEEKLENVRRLFVGHPDWEFRVIYAPPRTLDDKLETLSRDLIEDHLDRAILAFDVAGSVAGLLTAWSAFEAAARLLVPKELARPQPSARLLEVLAADGYLTPDEADLLRQVGRLRNEAAHGQLDATFAKPSFDELIRITRVLLDLSREAATAMI